MSKRRVAAPLALVVSLAAIAVLANGASAKSAQPQKREAVVKLGFITKFPVDFFFTLQEAAK